MMKTTDLVCEWCGSTADVILKKDAAGTEFMLCADCRDHISTFLQAKYPYACANLNSSGSNDDIDWRTYNLAQTITEAP